MRGLCVTASLVAVLFGSATAFARGSNGYEPGTPLVTCANNCAPLNGTCNTDCTITCNVGYFNCDSNVANGCECGNAADKCHDYSCSGATCASVSKAVGTDCSTDCLQNATCTASGTCNGTKARDNTPCATGPACTLPLACTDGTCSCPLGGTPVDMAMNHGVNHGGCDVAVGATAAASGMGALLLLLAGAFLFGRRRNRQ